MKSAVKAPPNSDLSKHLSPGGHLWQTDGPSWCTDDFIRLPYRVCEQSASGARIPLKRHGPTPWWMTPQQLHLRLLGSRNFPLPALASPKVTYMEK